ncbi:MAG: hypothetical protein J5752_02825 [Clostridiales bacterium]|nr:hypothetical protein [Clostridiales bacterium]
MGILNRESDEMVMKRLCGDAGHIVEMLKHVFTNQRGCDIRMALLFASGLAGYSCHQAVKEEKGVFQVVKTNTGKKFYFGDEVNKYLLENPNSVTGLVNAVVDLPEKKVLELVSSFAENCGKDDMLICGFNPGTIYTQIRQCWEGIYGNMTSKYCKNPSEYPLLFGIVLQNILILSVKAGAPKGEAGEIAIEVANAISKMDNDSF